MILFRWLRKKAAVLLLIVALAIALKHAYPQLGQTVGRWISGAEDSRVVRAVSSMVSSLTNGAGFKDAVEVFCETLQTYEAA